MIYLNDGKYAAKPATSTCESIRLLSFQIVEVSSLAPLLFLLNLLFPFPSLCKSPLYLVMNTCDQEKPGGKGQAHRKFWITCDLTLSLTS